MPHLAVSHPDSSVASQGGTPVRKLGVRHPIRCASPISPHESNGDDSHRFARTKLN